MSTEIAVNSASTIPINLHPLNGLNLRQNSFVDNYLQTGNGTLSAKLAGYPGTDEVLAVVAHRLLRSIKVRAEIQRRLGNHIAKADEILERLTAQARADLGEVLEPDGSLDWKRARYKDKTRLFKKVKYDKDTGRLTEIELYDAQAALDKLGRFHKLWDQQAAPSAQVNIEVNLTSNNVLMMLCEALGETIDITPTSE